MYLKAAGMMKLPSIDAAGPDIANDTQSHDAAFVVANTASIGLALEATARPVCSFYNRGVPVTGILHG